MKRRFGHMRIKHVAECQDFDRDKVLARNKTDKSTFWLAEQTRTFVHICRHSHAWDFRSPFLVASQTFAVRSCIEKQSPTEGTEIPAVLPAGVVPNEVMHSPAPLVL